MLRARSLAATLLLLGALSSCGDGGTDGEGSTPVDAGLDSGGDASSPPDGAMDAGPGTDVQPPPRDGGPDAGERDAGPGQDLGRDGGQSCRDDIDCTGCSYCDEALQVCVPCQCSQDRQCPEGEICEAYRCLPGCEQTGCGQDEICDPELSRCVPFEGCRRTAECPPDSVCVERQCVPADPYDSCAAPLQLLAGETLSASTRRTRDQAAGSCSSRPSPEAVLHFELSEAAGVRLEVDGAADRFDPRIFLRRGSCTDGEELACLDTPFLLHEQLELAQLTPGTYFLFVESFASEVTGDFEVDLELFPGGLCVDDPLEDNDSSAAPVGLQLAVDEQLALCPGDEDWYALPLFAGDELLLVVDLLLADGDDPAELQLALYDPAGAPLQAERTDDQSGRVVVRTGELPTTGTYLLQLAWGAFEDGEITPLSYGLRYETFTEHGTTDCTNPPSLTPGRPVVADTAAGENRTSASCTSELEHDAPELVYKLYLEQESSLTLEVEAQWQYALYLRSDCSSELPEAELACRAPGSLFLPAVQPGTYYAFVDGARGQSGPFNLQLQVGPAYMPPDNDRCDAAQELVPGQTVEGSTFLGRNDYRGSCTSPLSHDASDAVYRFTLDEPRLVVAELEPVAADGQPWAAALYLQSLCGNMGSEVACDSLGPRLEVALEPGEYFLVVDGWRSDSGPFSLRLQAQ